MTRFERSMREKANLEQKRWGYDAWREENVGWVEYSMEVKSIVPWSDVALSELMAGERSE
ncbi:hypothetical protein BGZ99_008469 [Dissophora globulifera]|uniref:Uncharacterized protein n=1 Tax=Dissophora globulifera TaxID=979702 RepID=A0A9P6RB80_9FUNG|nr:hypothetical protein BGZ99_008469 [Dissophora globulifera]